jgi:ubiquinone/menaquinone biosynthesis C-methylase UbiE
MYVAFENKLYLAPLENPQKVLDLGTGTGIWAM